MSGNSNNSAAAQDVKLYQSDAAPVEKMNLLGNDAGAGGKALSMDDGAAVQFDEARFQANSEETNAVSCCLSVLFPCVWLCSCFSIREQTSAVELRFGKYAGTHSEPGVRYSNPCGRELRYVSRKKQVCDIPLAKVIDLNGNPLNVSAVVTYYIENPLRAALAVENSHAFVRTTAHAIMRQVVSRYPYESRHGDHAQHNLKTESSFISDEAVQLLQGAFVVYIFFLLTHCCSPRGSGGSAHSVL